MTRGPHFLPMKYFSGSIRRPPCAVLVAFRFVRSLVPSRAGAGTQRRRRDRRSSARSTWNTSAPALSARNESSHRFGPKWASRIPNAGRTGYPALYETGAVQNVRIFAQPARRWRKVIVAVQTRSLVSEIEIDGAESVKARRSCAKNIKLKINQPVNEEQLEKGRQKIIEVYQAQGLHRRQRQFPSGSNRREHAEPHGSFTLSPKESKAQCSGSISKETRI